MICAAQCRDHLPWDKVPTAVTLCAIQALVVCCADVLATLLEESGMCQITATHWQKYRERGREINMRSFWHFIYSTGNDREEKKRIGIKECCKPELNLWCLYEHHGSTCSNKACIQDEISRWLLSNRCNNKQLQTLSVWNVVGMLIINLKLQVTHKHTFLNGSVCWG